ncbi:hypothetical protein TRIUR3_34137 [Triticum urartu]|uniref:Uncharacterized protein n=1 Tax=Triticum urartu TaxID=4572 RepID=M7ZLU8_TRIUA|nr:hypothetical protein TRIUR3_34137 [Triticum urartu]
MGPRGRGAPWTLVSMWVGESLDFYMNVLGFTPIRRPGSFDFDGAWLFNYGIGIHLLQSEHPESLPAKKEINPKDNHISFQCESMVAVERRLKELGIPYIQRCVEEGGIYVDQIFFHDPDGFMIEICNCAKLPALDSAQNDAESTEWTWSGGSENPIKKKILRFTKRELISYTGRILHVRASRELTGEEGDQPKDNHISFQCESMVAVERRLKELGIPYIQRCVEEGGIYVDQIFFHDPDGFMIEICNCDKLPVVPLAGQNFAMTACQRVASVRGRGGWAAHISCA